MLLSRRSLIAATAAVTALPRRSRAQARPTIRIGVMNDMSGPYRDVTGPTGVACAKQAVREFAPGAFDVEVLSADHQNKPDVAVSLAREWSDQRCVDIIIDVAATSCALALASVCKEKNKIMIADDDFFGPGKVREDGRKLTPAYLFEGKKPAESKGEWDLYKLIGTTPADEAFRPLSDGCVRW